MVSSALVTSCLALVLTVNPLVAKTAFIYHNFEQLTQFLEETHRKFPDITRLSSIGKSVEGRDLWVLTLSTQPDEHVLLQPELQYIGNMHGNEAVGREMLIHLIDYMTSQYGERDDVTTLLRTSRVHILVSMNPDGFELAQRDGKEGICSGTHGRMNANDYDLNRNFPDYFQPNPHPLQPETLAVMGWLKDVQFTLAANLHGGALVVVYPYDNYFADREECPEILYCYRAKLDRSDCSCHCNEEDLSGGRTCPDKNRLGPFKGRGYSKSSDDDVFRHISLAYAKKHPAIAGAVCGRSTYPADGVMNGASWYVIRGGMQGYAYAYAGLKEVTLEVSCCKFPNRTELPTFWEHNRESLIAFLLEGHRGVKGIVSDSDDNQPIKGASVEIVGRYHPSNTTGLGEFWRTLLPGTYTIKVTADTYTGISQDFTVYDGNATVLYLSLDKNRTAPTSDPSTAATTDASSPATTASVTSPSSPQTSTNTESLPEPSETPAFTARPPVTSSRPHVTSSRPLVTSPAFESTSDKPSVTSSQSVTSSADALSGTMSPPTFVTSENESDSSTVSTVTSSRRPRTNDDRSGRGGSSSASRPARFSLVAIVLCFLGLRAVRIRL